MVDKTAKKATKELYQINKVLYQFLYRYKCHSDTMAYLYEYYNSLATNLDHSPDELKILDEYRPLYEQNLIDWHKWYQYYKQKYHTENQLIRSLKPQIVEMIKAVKNGTIPDINRDEMFPLAIASMITMGRNLTWFEEISPWPKDGKWLEESETWLEKGQWEKDKGRWHIMFGDKLDITSENYDEFVTALYNESIERLKKTSPEGLSRLQEFLDTV